MSSTLALLWATTCRKAPCGQEIFNCTSLIRVDLLFWGQWPVIWASSKKQALKWRENISTLIYVKIAVKCWNIGWSKICTQEFNCLLSNLFIQDEQSEHLESGHEPRGRDHYLLFKTGTWLSQQVLANPLSQYMHWAFLLHPTEYITFHV